MDWTHFVSALYGVSFTGLFAWGLYRVTREKAADEELTPPTARQLARNENVRALFEQIKELQRQSAEDKGEEEIVEEVDERDAIDKAFDMLDEQENSPGVQNNVFPLGPRLTDPQPEKKRLVAPTHAKAEHKIIKPTPGHPCRFLDGTPPPHFRDGECSGVCRYPRQNGRACFWAPNVATQCSYFDPKVRPRVKLRTTA